MAQTNLKENTSGITDTDLAGAIKVAGLDYTADQRQAIQSFVTEDQKAQIALRQCDLDEEEPAIQFNPIVPGIKLPRGKSSCRISRSPMPAVPDNLEDLAFASVVQLSRLIKARKITSLALTQMYLTRLRRHSPVLNCTITRMESSALEQAAQADKEIANGHYRGPLHGIPWGVKDLFASKGVPTTWGAKIFEHRVFDYDATVIERLNEAGAVLVAKLSVGELALNETWYGGQTKNPWNTKEGSGGSSAGPASAVAAGLVGFAIGTETFGSILFPCGVCGTTGLRPTYGRVSRHGLMPLTHTFDKVGPICRGVEDCALVLSSIHGPDPRDSTVADIPFQWNLYRDTKTIRVGYEKAEFDSLKPGTPDYQAYRGVLETLQRLGYTLHPVTVRRDIPGYDSRWLAFNAETASCFQQMLRRGTLDGLASPNWPMTFRIGSLVPGADYLQVMRLRRMLQKAMANVFEEVDVYVTRNLCESSSDITNFTGNPVLTTRCGLTENKPQNVDFVGRVYDEATLLRVGLAYEQATSWHKQWPNLHSQ